MRIAVFCKECGKLLGRNACYLGTVRCHSCKIHGSRNPNFGKKETHPNYKDGRDKRRNTCACGKTISRSATYRGVTECQSCVARRMTGPLSHNWNGGVTPLQHLVRSSKEYKEWVQRVFSRDDFTCRECGSRGFHLHAHHLVSFSKIFQGFLARFSQFSPLEDKETLIRLVTSYDPFWDISNGITYCKSCHFLAHKKDVEIRTVV